MYNWKCISICQEYKNPNRHMVMSMNIDVMWLNIVNYALAGVLRERIWYHIDGIYVLCCKIHIAVIKIDKMFPIIDYLTYLPGLKSFFLWKHGFYCQFHEAMILHALIIYYTFIHVCVVNSAQIAKFMAPTWGPPGSCRPHMGPMLAPWTLLSGCVLVLSDSSALIVQGYSNASAVSMIITFYQPWNWPLKLEYSYPSIRRVNITIAQQPLFNVVDLYLIDILIKKPYWLWDN